MEAKQETSTVTTKDTGLSEDDMIIAKLESVLQEEDKRRLSLEEFKCKVDVWVISVSCVDSTNQTFRVRFEIAAFRSMTRKEKLNYMKNPKEWRPTEQLQPYMSNSTVEVIEREQMYYQHGDSFLIYYDNDFKSASIETQWRICAVIGEPMELQNFPFDYQHFSIDFNFETRDTNMRDNKHKMVGESCTFFMPSDSLNLIGFHMRSPHLEMVIVDSWLIFVQCRFTLHREWQFYISRVVIVLAIISFITNFAFVFGNDTISDRFGFISSMLLAAVAYMFVTTNYLPPLKYLTLLDKYVFLTFSFILWISIECGALGIAEYNSWFEDDNIDMMLFVINLSIWFIAHIVFIVRCKIAYNTELKKADLLKDDIDTKTEYYTLQPTDKTCNFFEQKVKEHELMGGYTTTVMKQF